MTIKYFLLIFATLCLLSNYANADARLEKKLGLNVDKARQTQEIQKKYRQKFRVKRQVLHRENRKLRRARNDNDSTVIAQQQKITKKLKSELKQIRLNEDDEIRKILTPDQLTKFEEIIQQRKDSVGSSRDEKDF